jgi:trimethylamine:corrinoid methyltransferase-like protein
VWEGKKTQAKKQLPFMNVGQGGLNMNRRIPLLKLLSDGEIEKLHTASLSVLARTRVEVLHEGALKKLADF